MSSTNKTTYYELPQFVDNDIFNPLADDNDAYAKIDTALHNIANAEADDANEIVGVKSRLTSAEGTIDVLEAQNGNDVLTTTAQTLSGAVNELDADTSTLDGRVDIVENDINNVSTGLKAKVTALETQNGNEALLTTAQTLSGAVNELNKLAVFVTPEMFGGVGDGNTDDTNAVQSALNTGLPVDLCDKTYAIGSALNIPSNADIKHGTLKFSLATKIFIADTASHIRIKNVKFLVAYLEGIAANNRIDWFPIHFENCNDVIIDDCIIDCKDCRSMGFISSNNVKVQNSQFNDCEGTGLTFDACNYIEVENCSFNASTQYDNSWHTLDVYGKAGNSKFISITNCFFDRVHGSSIQLTSTPNTYDIIGALISNCEFTNQNDACIKIDGVMSTVNISDCIFNTTDFYGDANSSYGISLGGASGLAYDVRVNGCTFENLHSYAIAHKSDALNNAKILEVKNCRFINGGRLYNAGTGFVETFIFENNYVDNVRAWVAIRTDNIPAHSVCVFKNNVITDDEQFFIRLFADVIECTGNIFNTDTGQDTHAVLTLGGASFARLENNYVHEIHAYTSKLLANIYSTIALMSYNGNYYEGNEPVINNIANVTALKQYTITP